MQKFEVVCLLSDLCDAAESFGDNEKKKTISPKQTDVENRSKEITEKYIYCIERKEWYGIWAWDMGDRTTMKNGKDIENNY